MKRTLTPDAICVVFVLLLAGALVVAGCNIPAGGGGDSGGGKASAPGGPLFVGVGARKITPSQVTPYLPLAGFQGAYAFDWRYATTIHDDIWARTIAVRRGNAYLVMTALDLVGTLHVDINPIKRRVVKELNVPFSSIVIASTHCHSAPDPVGLFAGYVDEQYMKFVRDQTYLSIKDALGSMVQVRMKAATTHHIGAWDPATRRLERDPAKMNLPMDLLEWQRNPGKYDRFVLQEDLRDPVVRNTMITAVQFDDASTGRTVATLVNYHLHPEVLSASNTRISSDFPHFLRQRVEKRLGGTCVYFSGTTGGQIGALHHSDIPLRDAAGNPVHEPGVFDAQGNPFPKMIRKAGIDKIRSIGFVVADDAVDALLAAPYSTSTDLAVRTDDLDVDLENPMYWMLVMLLSSRSDMDPKDKPLHKPYFQSVVGGFRVQVTVATLGDVGLVTGPGEVFPEHFLGRKASVADYGSLGFPKYVFPAMPALGGAMKTRHKLVFGLANNYLGYMIPRSDSLRLEDGRHPNHYEEKVSAGPNYGDNVGNKLFQMLGSPLRFTNYPIRP